VAVELELHDQRGLPIAYASTAPMLSGPMRMTAGSEATYSFHLGPLPLATGVYYIYFWLIHPWAANHDVVKQPLSFEVIASDPGRTGFDFRQSYGRGACTLPLTWTVDTRRATH
jgi:hypothetical protein